jgi:hypothetical protein
MWSYAGYANNVLQTLELWFQNFVGNRSADLASTGLDLETEVVI